MMISGLVKSSLVDFPGLISCILFVPGCNYNCFYCHNRPLIDGSQELFNLGQVQDFLKKRRGQLDGIVITGGEPTLQPGLIPFIKMIKELGYQIKLDTNGSSPQVIAQLLKEHLCDYYAVDYKAPLARYPEICGRGANGETVLKTIVLLQNSGVNFEVRTTVIPQFALDDLICMAKELPLVPRYVLNRYRIPEVYLAEDQARIEIKAYTQAQISDFAHAIAKDQPHVVA